MPKIKLGAKAESNSRPADYAKVLETGDSFVTSGSLCGSAGEVMTLGRLNDAWKGSVCRADYVVYSYDTPIAWRVAGEDWTVPTYDRLRTTEIPGIRS